MNLTPRAQESAWKTLKTLAPALPQGLILVGPSGVGKRRAVRALFQWMNCEKCRGQTQDQEPQSDGALFGAPPTATPLEEPCGVCASCRKISEGNHLDLIEILPKGENISVDDLREMKKTLFFPPVEAKVRFVVIDEAHKLNLFSANNLLKTLEEPPSHTRFFLVTHERGLLLPTIISRCQFVHFSPLDRASLQTLVKEMKIEVPAKLEPLYLDLLGGGLNRAALLSDHKVLEFLEDAQSSLEKVARGSTMRWGDIAAFADQLLLGGEDLKLELLLDMLVKFGHDASISASQTRNLEQAQNTAEIALEASYLRRRLSRHANKKLVALASSNLLSQIDRGGL